MSSHSWGNADCTGALAVAPAVFHDIHIHTPISCTEFSGITSDSKQKQFAFIASQPDWPFDPFSETRWYEIRVLEMNLFCLWGISGIPPEQFSVIRAFAMWFPQHSLLATREILLSSLTFSRGLAYHFPIVSLRLLHSPLLRSLFWSAHSC